MPRSTKRLRQSTVAEAVLDVDTPESSVLDLLDSLLNKGVMVNGDVTLGVAGIDLIYLRLSSILCAADRVLPPDRSAPARKTRRRRAPLFKRTP